MSSAVNVKSMGTRKNVCDLLQKEVGKEDWTEMLTMRLLMVVFNGDFISSL